jgi:hypothetical protein
MMILVIYSRWHRSNENKIKNKNMNMIAFS